MKKFLLITAGAGVAAFAVAGLLAIVFVNVFVHVLVDLLNAAHLTR